MAMEIPAKALLVIKGTPSRTTVPGAKDIQTMQKVLSGLPVTIDCAQSEVMRVQCNPSSPSIRVRAQSIRVNSVQKSGETAGVRQEEEPPSVELSAKLVFTAVNFKDAFIAGKFRLPTGDTVSDGVAITKAVDGGYTVRPQINGLVGVVMDIDARGMAFAWQDMVFEDQVSSLRSSYNMFNISGNPINSSIDMSITQNISEASITAQNKALDKCFTSGMVGKSPLGKAGSLINLSL